MVTLKPVRRNDVRPLVAMTVAPGDAGFVSTNAITLAEAPFEPGSEVFAIWAADQLVGLVAVVDNRDYPYLEPEDDPNSAFMWRLMVDHAHQGKGHGRAALQQIFDWARARGLRRIFTSVVSGNDRARVLYESMGFVVTGRMLEEEAEMCCDLPGLAGER